MGFEKEVDRLIKSINSVSDQIRKKVIDFTSSDNTSNAYWSSMSNKLREDFEELRVIFGKWVNDNIPDEYYRAIQETVKTVKRIPIASTKEIKYSTIIQSTTTQDTLSKIINDSLTSMLTGLDGGEKTLNQLLRLSQQTLIQEKQLNELVEQGFVEGGKGVLSENMVGQGSMYGIKRRVQTELEKQMLEDKFITVVNINGQQMHFDPGYYAELIARTKYIEASNIGSMQVARETGTDLIQITDHNTDCEECMEFEGKIFSVSGNDPDFPPLEELPPYHPNCKHTSVPVYREYLEDKDIDKYIEFSQGESDIHPTNPAFVPVGER